MVKAARDNSTPVAVDCLRSLTGLLDPTPEQAAGLTLVALFFEDIHLLRRAQSEG